MGTSRNDRRRNRVKQLPIRRVLADLGYRVHSEGDEREEQFQCDLHGDGHDNKPSARVYPATNLWYCFACGQSRDALATIREKQGLSFMDALKWLETTYNLPPLPFEAGEDERPPTPAEEVSAALQNPKTVQMELHRLQTQLDSLTRERTLPLDTVLTFWEAFDKMVFWHAQKKVTDEQALQALEKLRLRLRETLERTPT